MNDFEKELTAKLQQADFSAETDLKQRLYQKLFGKAMQTNQPRIVQLPFKRMPLSDDLLELVNAAGESVPATPKDKPELP